MRFPTIAAALTALQAQRVTGAELTESALAACESGEGPKAALTVYRARAVETARHIDTLRAQGAVLPALGGVPLTIKDLFDVGGEPTRAGAVLEAGAAPAAADAPAVQHLRAQGAVITAKTNMTEFAFSGVGMNPHHGTPANPIDRADARIPGGSSSGAAVSVADGMALGAIGSDTAGSLRVPAALCGLTGFKPTSRRHSTRGVFPLARSLDTIGPIARTVDCCRRLDAALAGQTAHSTPLPLAGARLAVPQRVVLDGMEKPVSQAFERALTALSKAGAILVDIAMPELALSAEIAALGNIAPAEAFAVHRKRLAKHRDLYDPRVAQRIAGGERIGVADYLDMLTLRGEMRARADLTTAMFDALIMPTVPIQAPRIADLATDEAFFAANGLLLRNTLLANLLDRPAISLPANRVGETGVGLSVIGETGRDARLLDLAEAVERTLTPEPARTVH